jgi:hypothetical protein
MVGYRVAPLPERLRQFARPVRFALPLNRPLGGPSRSDTRTQHLLPRSRYTPRALGCAASGGRDAVGVNLRNLHARFSSVLARAVHIGLLDSRKEQLNVSP